MGVSDHKVYSTGSNSLKSSFSVRLETNERQTWLYDSDSLLIRIDIFGTEHSLCQTIKRLRTQPLFKFEFYQYEQLYTFSGEKEARRRPIAYHL